MLFPGIVSTVRIIPKGCIDAALGRDGMGADGVDLGKERNVIFFAKPHSGAQSCKPAPDYDDIMFTRYHTVIKYM